MLKKFFCKKCNKKKSGNFYFDTDSTWFYGSKPCPDCRKMKQKGVFLFEGKREWRDKMTFIGCLECNPLMGNDNNLACCDCFFGWKGKRSQSDLLTKLNKENQELRQQLLPVEKQLTEVLEELKKLKNNLNDKDIRKLELEYQIVQDEKLIKDIEWTSLAKVQEQINKSQALMKRVQNTSANFSVKSSGVRKGSNSHLILGCLVVIVSGLIIFMGGLLVGKRSERVKN